MFSAAILPALLGRDCIGGGDAWLCAAIGSLLGPIPSMLVIALSLILLLGFGKITGAVLLPMAPFLLGAYIFIFTIGAVIF